MRDKNLVELGLKIRALRKSAKLSQEELAHQSNLDLSYYGRIERGENNPSNLTLLSIAEALKVTVLEIFLLS